jgi:hypothetical protein
MFILKEFTFQTEAQIGEPSLYHKNKTMTFIEINSTKPETILDYHILDKLWISDVGCCRSNMMIQMGMLKF